MNTPFILRFIRAAAAVGCATALSTFPLSATAQTTGAQLGLTETLTTSGFHFVTGATTPPTAVAPPLTLPTSFPASYSLTNHTGAPIDFGIPTPIVGPGVMVIYVPSIIFEVYDSEGKLVWASAGEPNPAVATKPVPRTLPAGASWHATVQVPLKLADGQFLSGAYRLVARVNGSPDFGSKASFTVGLAPVPLTK